MTRVNPSAELARRLGGRPKAAFWPPQMNEAVEWLVSTSREAGALTKRSFLERFPRTSNEEYELLKRSIPHCFRDLVGGPRGRGGWRLRRRPAPAGRSPSATPAAAETIEIALDDQLSSEQSIVANQLEALLSGPMLRRLVGDSALNSLRSLVRAVHGREPSLSKRSLAAALLLRDGTELLADHEARKLIARQAGVENVTRWYPGKSGALQFVRALQWPASYAGAPQASAPDAVEYLEPRIALPSLADFQRKVKQDVKEHLESAPRCILTMPTGAGKTRTAVEFVRDFAQSVRTGVYVWVAHTEELLEQAAESVRQVWVNSTDIPAMRLDRRFGGHGRGEQADAECIAAGFGGLQLLIVTPVRLLHDLDRWEAQQPERMAEWRERLRLLVIDEAHRAAAPQYQALLERLAPKRSGAKVLGLTATPFRHEYLHQDPELGTRELFKLFRRIAQIGEDPRRMLQEQGYLSWPVEQQIHTGRNLSVAGLGAGDAPDIETLEQIDRRLSAEADQTQRRTFVYGHLIEICRGSGNRVIYFGPSVEDAETIAFMLRAQGIAAGVVSGRTRAAERRRIIAEFKSGQLSVLCNCEVLTTGFDAPQTTHVVIARPTVSHVLFEQMVGRGLRGPRFGGTSHCHVVHFVDTLDAERPRLGFHAWRSVWGLAPSAPASA